MIGHGASKFLKERLFEKSDFYQVYICELCGNFASTPTECRACDTNKVQKISLPYAAKLLSKFLLYLFVIYNFITSLLLLYSARITSYEYQTKTCCN